MAVAGVLRPMSDPINKLASREWQSMIDEGATAFDEKILVFEMPRLFWSASQGRVLIQAPSGRYYPLGYDVLLDSPIERSPDMAELQVAPCEVTNGDIGHNYTGPLMDFTYKIYDCLCIKQESHVEHECAHGERWLT